MSFLISNPINRLSASISVCRGTHVRFLPKLSCKTCESKNLPYKWLNGYREANPDSEPCLHYKGKCKCINVWSAELQRWYYVPVFTSPPLEDVISWHASSVAKSNLLFVPRARHCIGGSMQWSEKHTVMGPPFRRSLSLSLRIFLVIQNMLVTNMCLVWLFFCINLNSARPLLGWRLPPVMCEP